MIDTLRRFLRAELRFLTFRSSPVAAEDLGPFLAMALTLTWIAGLGRYWDHPHADVWQYAGLGSVAYVFVLAAVLWLVGKPLRPRGWSYRAVLLFVCMTSPPAILYAIPVERFTTFEVATSMNLWFLGVVAVWRVALLLRHLAVAAGLGYGLSITASLLPLSAIVTALTMLNLQHATFELMVMGDRHQTSQDEVYSTVMLLSLISILALLPLVVCYCASIGVRRRKLGLGNRAKP